ncbi:MAG: FtsX-like permease family protein, partial [Gemmatimonadetes bacterium]|nr:FtsX-like permease family protein [Gemmatimonadota bacterium]
MTAWLIKMAWRDSRNHRRKLLLFTSSITIGIGALVGMGSLSATLEDAIDEQAASLLGADITIESRQPFTPDAEALIDSIGGTQARQISFNSMVYLPKSQDTRLAQIRALTGPFPFYGELKTAPAQAAQNFRSKPEALVDEALMLQFGAAVGDSIKIGDTVFAIGGRLLRIPGENALFSDIQPRVYISMDYLEGTRLIQKGSRVTYTAFFCFTDGRDVQAIEQAIRPQTRDNRLRVETIADRKRRLGRTLGNLYRFLNLGSFIALLLGGVGVASAIHAYTKQKLPTVAILRSLGATARQTFLIYLIQAGAMGFIGSLVGALLGLGVLYSLPSILADVLPLEVTPSFNVFALLEGLGLGLGISLLFAALPLLA